MALSEESFTPQLRPLSIGETLDAGFRLFRQRFGALVLATLVPLVPLAIIGVLWQGSIDETAFDVDAPLTGSSSQRAGETVANFTLGIAAVIAVVVCLKIISAAYLGERVGPGESLRYGLGRLPVVLIAGILAFLAMVPVFAVVAVAPVLFLLLLVNVWLFVRLALTVPAAVAERTGPLRALNRSWNLTRHNWWRLFGTLVVLFLISLVIQFAIGFVFGIIAAAVSIGEAAYAALWALTLIGMGALVHPLTAAILAVAYYDSRVRNEGFDLQLLAQGVGVDSSRFERSPERPEAPPPPSSGGGFRPPGEATTAS
jgi:Membrane domain of glycerophosphoryl diester phosphodiesterase